MSKALKGLLITLALIITAFIAAYIGLGFYYINGFPCFTWINGVYCTGKSVDEINEELCKKYQYDGITITDIDGAELFVSSKDADVKVDFTNTLNTYLSDKNSFAWGYYFFKGLVADFSPDVSIDKEKIENVVSDWEIFVDDNSLVVSIEKTKDSGYVLKNGLEKVPVKDEIVNVVFEKMESLDTELDLSEYDNCYTSKMLTAEQQSTVELFEKIDKLQTCGISYVVNDVTIPISKETASGFILKSEDLEYAKSQKVSKKQPWSGYFIVNGNETKLPDEGGLFNIEGFLMDEDGNLILSESRMHDYLYSLSLEHGTSWALDQYRNGNEEAKIYINDNSKGDGSIYDIESEFAHLKEEYINGTNQTEEIRELKLSDTAVAYDAKDSLGDTYIEVNMGKQELTYYVDGQFSMNMPIVTGNVNRGRGTPTGIFPVYNKRYHTNLVGVDYVSYVNYWLGVNKGVGIHDATWRSKFGEEIYKKDGSHGCINCPLDNVSVLWEVVEVGTPVILYY